MGDGSVFHLEPAEVHWLAKTFDHATPQRALLASLAMSADAKLASRGIGHGPDGHGSPPLGELLSEDEVGAIVCGVIAAYPELPIPPDPGPAQLEAIDAAVR